MVTLTEVVYEPVTNLPVVLDGDRGETAYLSLVYVPPHEALERVCWFNSG